ncbi:MAG: hypothetical protein JWN67_2170 [Actinomycetia bacterium]|nr:hypothetical protein [Actinomycetes bacterium]
MSLVVLLILAVVWAVFLVPQVLRHRAEKTPADSIGAFRNQLNVLERTTPGMLGRSRPAMPQPSGIGLGRPVYRSVSQKELVRRRRANILFGLLAAMGTTLLLGLLVPKLLVVHVVLDLLFVAYCAMLVRARNVVAEREMKVRYLPGPSMGAEQPFLLRRSGS